MDKDLIRMNYESAIFSLAYGVTPEIMITVMEDNAIDNEFDAAEGIKQALVDFLPKKVIKEFIKNRFNNSLESIGISKVFDVDEALVAETDWFDDEIIGTKHGDFFVKRSINYSKRTKSITSDDLF